MTKEEYEKIKKQKVKEDAERELLSGKLGAIDNLWSPQQELKIYTFDGFKKPRKLVLKPKGSKYNDNYVPEFMPIEGVMVFYINRDEQGKPVGEPKKYLRIIEKGIWKDEFIDGDLIEPYYVDIIRKKGKGYSLSQLEDAKRKFKIKDVETVKTEDLLASKFTGLDDINVAMSKYGADGLDLSNASGLDDSILEKHSNLINESLLDGLTENTSLLNADGDYYNLINESLLDGLTENTSLLNADGENYSNGIGDWFKKTFGKKEEKKALEIVSNPETDIVDAKTMVQAHKESGSDKPLRDWLRSGGGKDFLKSVLDVATVFLAKAEEKKETEKSDKTDTKSTTETDTKTDTKTDDKKDGKEVKILGMTPITFGIVAVGVLALTSVIVIVAMRKK